MRHEVEPSAEALWASVSTTVTENGTEEHKPQNDEEWFAVRGHAITLMESANLIVMDGRAGRRALGSVFFQRRH